MNDNGRDPRFDAEKRLRAVELYESGLGEAEVGEKLGLSRTRARELLDEMGVERRKRGRPTRKA